MCILFRPFNKNRQCNGQRKSVSCLGPLTRTDNAMCILFRPFNKRRQCNGQTKSVSCLGPLTRTDNAMANRNVYSVYSLEQEQTRQWPKEMCILFRPFNKNRQCNGQRKCVSCLGPLTRTDNAMCILFRPFNKRRQCNGQTKCVSCLGPLTRTDNAMAKGNLYPA